MPTVQARRPGPLVVLVLATMVVMASLAADAPKDSDKKRQTPPVRVERYSTRFVFQNDGTGVVTSDIRYRVLSEAGRQGAGQAYVLFASRSEEGSVERLRTIKPDGRILDADGAAMDVTPPPTAQAPQFSDLQAKVRLARSVEVGDAVEFRLVRSIVRPLKPGAFWAVHSPLVGLPSDEQDVTLDVPTEPPALVRWEADHNPRQDTKDGRKSYTWTVAADNLDSDEPRPRRPLFVASSMTPEQLGAWYVGLQADRSDVTPEIRAKVESLTAGMTTPRQKLEAIYAFVATSVRYVSLSFGIGGYQPHPPSEVFHNLFGDCKDKDLLLRTMLSAAGIPAQSAIVNSALGIPEPEVGAPAQFDHVMTVATIDGEAIWMDATSGMAPFGVLDPQLRGRKALLPSAQGARVVDIPVRSPIADRGSVEMKGKLDAVGKLAVDSTITAAGLGEMWLRAMVAARSASSNEFLGNVFATMTTGFGSTLEKFESSDAAAIAVPLRIQFTTSDQWIEPEEMKADQQLPSALIGIRFVSWSSRALEKLVPGEPLRLGDPGELRESLSLALDPSYAVTVPASVKVERPFGVYESAYSVVGGTLTARRTLTVLEPQLAPAKKDDLIAFHDLIERDLDQKFVIRRSGKPDLRKLAATLDADALNRAGSRAFDDGDYELAFDLLKKATEKNPKHKWAWNNLGRAQIATWDLDAAEGSFAKQLEINPKDEYAHNNLGRVYQLRGDFHKAEAQFRKQLEVNPLDWWANSNLGALLSAQERWTEAVDVLSRAVQVHSDNTVDQSALATALAKTGRRDEALAHATALLTDNLTAEERLQIARVLAEQGLDLDRADSEAGTVMREAASRCRGVSLDSVPTDYWKSIGLLTAGYEVRGAAAFRKGDLSGALTLFRTAYDLAPWPTTALWLARTYARQGDPATGMRYYAFASRTSFPPRPIAPPEELREYVAREFKGDAGALGNRVAELSKESLMIDRVYPEKGEFVVPEEYPGDSGLTFEIKVLVDENGVVEAATPKGGREPFLGSALKDVRRIRFRPVGLPGAPIKSVRIIEFFYLPTKEIRAFTHFQPPADAKQLRIEQFYPILNGLAGEQ